MIQIDTNDGGNQPKQRPSITFSSLTFSDGTTVTLDSNDVVVFVGPNNAGKSAALRELNQFIGDNRPKTIIKLANLIINGTSTEVQHFIEANLVKIIRNGTPIHGGLGFEIDTQYCAINWPNNLALFQGLFCRRLATESRITDSNPVDAIDFSAQPPQHPIQLLFGDDRLEAKMSGYFKRAFDFDLIVDRLTGKVWSLLVGERLTPEVGEDRISHSFVKRLRNATMPLQNQGDGMRSFASVILHLLAANTQTVLLLDEPEAFLHPPQARLLGEFIANEKPEGSQLFIATHSPDVLQGLLTTRSSLRVIRIQRQGSINRVRQLDKSKAKIIAGDPVMKFTNVLSGVFHQRVIICEADADCLFYSTILNALSEQLYPDVLFIHANGKHRMASLAVALQALDVKVDVIADIDVLQAEEDLKRIVEALGAPWDSIEADARALKTAIEQKKPWLDAAEVTREIREVLKEAPEAGEFPKNLRKKIEAIYRKSSPWSAVKEAGQAAIGPGQPTVHFQKLLETCKQYGLWIVPVGELENFCKSEGGHGPNWVQSVLANHDLKIDPALAAARDFVEAIWNRP